jgi:hypothetical protein
MFIKPVRLLLFPIAGALALCYHPAGAQEPDPFFSQFDQASLVSGYHFEINGSAAMTTDLSSLLNSSPDIQFGFLQKGEDITLHLSGADQDFAIGAGGGDVTLTGIDGIYLIQNTSDGTDGLNSLTANITGLHPVLTNYNGSTVHGYWTGGAAWGANFPFYQDGGFQNNTKWLSDGNGTNYQYGDYVFYGLAPGSNGSNASGPVELGLFAQGIGGDGQVHTGFLALGSFAPVPEPTYIQLGGLLALGGLGPAFRLLKTRRKA